MTWQFLLKRGWKVNCVNMDSLHVPACHLPFVSAFLWFDTHVQVSSDIWSTDGHVFNFFLSRFFLENTWITHIIWEETQTRQTTNNKLSPLYQSWLCRWGIHASADIESPHQHQAHASSNIGERRQRTTVWRDSIKIPHAFFCAPEMRATIRLHQICPVCVTPRSIAKQAHAKRQRQNLKEKLF